MRLNIGQAFGLVRLLVGATLVVLVSSARAQVDPFPEIARAYLVELDGAPLWARHADEALAPASLTKLMTALLAAEAGAADQIVTVDDDAAAETGSRIGLRAGDRVRAGDLLAATLIGSANDACGALADWVAGSRQAFVERMNRRAAALGLSKTAFTNPCGHDAPGHLSTANDLAALAAEAMKVTAIASLVKRIDGEIATVDGTRRFRFDNRNALIGRYPGAVGVKSGFTARAGKCVIALARRDGHSALVVLLNAPDRWWTAHALLDRAFAHAGAPSVP
ncbi:MAG: D-alanyl-D-alanine carboxypeptidase [Betaproteobacteria bacterium]|nr:D-alanyl-D-alanine carboxypeptidase [Betaproteobacteria bacterium]